MLFSQIFRNTIKYFVFAVAIFEEHVSADTTKNYQFTCECTNPPPATQPECAKYQTTQYCTNYIGGNYCCDSENDCKYLDGTNNVGFKGGKCMYDNTDVNCGSLSGSDYVNNISDLCYDKSSGVCTLHYLSAYSSMIGVNSSDQCVWSSTDNTSMSLCNTDYCKSSGVCYTYYSNKATAYWTYNIFGVKSDQTCVKTNINQVLADCYTDVQLVCLNSSGYCVNLQITTAYLAKSSSLQCLALEEEVNSGDYIISCSLSNYQYCSTGTACVQLTTSYSQSHSVFGLSYTSPNFYFTCVNQGVQVAIKCDDYYCTENQACYALDPTNANRIGKAQDGSCMGYNNAVDQDPLSCAKNYCIYDAGTSGKYCELIGNKSTKCKLNTEDSCLFQSLSVTSTASPGLRLTQQSLTGFCLIINTDSTTGVKTVTCNLDNESTTTMQATSNEYVCESYQDSQDNSNAIYCALGQYCLYTDGKCYELDDAAILGVPARLSDSTCGAVTTSVSVKCSSTTCLLSSQCLYLTPLKYIAQEELTSLCLLKTDVTSYGVYSCYKSYCKRINLTSNLYECVKMEDDNSFAADEDGICLTKTEAQDVANTIKYCQDGVYCIDPSTGRCELIDSNTMCMDSLGQCQPNTSTSCAGCSITQCYSTVQSKCVNMDTTQCVGYDNTCLDITSSATSQAVCRACASSMCFKSVSNTCIDSTNISVTATQCYKWVSNNQDCSIIDMDSVADTCATAENKCTTLTSGQCVRCGSSYLNVGDFVCYSLYEQVMRKGNASFLSLGLKYVALGYSSSSGACSTGCSQCSTSVTICSLCSYGYFRYKINNNNYICIKCNVATTTYSSYTELDYVQSMFSTIKGIENDLSAIYTQVDATCSECASNINDWNLPSSAYTLRCTQFELSYGSKITRIAYLDTYELYYIDTSSGYSIKPATTENSKCGKVGCQTCLSSYQCKVCMIGYALNMGYTCIPCPSNCVECFYGGYYNNENVNWNDLMSTWSDYSSVIFTSSQYRLVCKYCLSGYGLYSDYLDCVECEDGCNSCAYTNGYVYIINRFNLLDYADSKFQLKCLECEDDKVIDGTGAKCIDPIDDCIDMQLSEESSMISYSLNWFYKSRDDFNESDDKRCFRCKNPVNPRTVATNMLSQVGTPYADCDKTGSSTIDNCNHELKQDQTWSSVKSSCLECSSKLVFDYTTYTCLVTQSCPSFLANCINCYSYLCPVTNETIYQCTKCESGMMPTRLGCVACPEGCTTCFEISKTMNSSGDVINFTNQLIYYNLKESHEDRLIYKSLYSIITVCGACEEGYNLSPETSLCTTVSCGSNCNWCYNSNGEGICISCQNILSQIANILPYLEAFYNTQISEGEMVNFNADKTNCHVCPYGCQGCDETDTSTDGLNLFQTKCYACKDIDTLSTSLKADYQFKFDNQRGKCTLCQRTDENCYYSKTMEVFAQCSTAFSPVGDGTSTNPFNIMRFSDIDWNSAIFGLDSYEQTIIYINELTLKVLSLIVTLVDTSCEVDTETLMKTTLMTIVPSLTTLSLTIRSTKYLAAGTSDWLTVYNMYLSKNFTIVGFSDVKFENVNLIQSSIAYLPHMLYVYTPADLNNMYFTNVTFDTQLSAADSLATPFAVVTHNLTSSFQMNTVRMKNFNIYDGYFFNFTRSSNFTNGFTISLIGLNVTGMTFDKASLIYVKTLYQGLTVTNLTISSSTFTNYAVWLSIQLYNTYAYLYSTWTTVEVSNCVFKDYSQLISHKNFLYFTAQNFSIFSNTLTNNPDGGVWKVYPLFAFNRIQCTTLNFTNNVVTSYLTFGTLTETSVYSIAQYLVEKVYAIIDIYFSKNTVNQIGPAFALIGDSNNVNKEMYVENMVIESQVCDLDTNSNAMFWLYVNDLDSIMMVNVNMIESNHPGILATSAMQSISVESFVLTKTATTFTIEQNMFFFQNVDALVQFKGTYLVNLVGIDASIVNIENTTENLLSPTKPTVIIENAYIDNVELIVANSLSELSLFYMFSVNVEIVEFRSSKVNNVKLVISDTIIYLGTSAASTLCIFGTSAQVSIIDSSFSDLISSVSRNGIILSCESVTISNSFFYNSVSLNQPTDLSIIYGGFIYMEAEEIKISSTSFKQGFAQKGGALYISCLGDTTIDISSTNFNDNGSSLYSSTSEGGAIYLNIANNDSLDMYVEDTLFSANYARSYGGAISVSSSRTNLFFSFITTTFTNNLSGISGGIMYARLPNPTQAHFYMEENSVMHDQILIQSIADTIVSVLSTTETDFSTSALFDLKSFQNVIIDTNQFRMTQELLTDSTLCTGLFRITAAVQLTDRANEFTYSQVCAPFITYNSQLLDLEKSLFAYIYQTTYAKSSMTIQTMIDISSYGNTHILKGRFKNINCKYCNITAIQIASQYLQITQSNFSSITSPYGGAFSYHNYSIVGVATPEQSPFRMLLPSGEDSDDYKNEMRERDDADWIVDSAESSQAPARRMLLISSFLKTIDIIGCRFNSNVATNNGGAILIHSHGYLQLNVTNSTFYANQAGGKGGAIYLAQLNNSQQYMSSVNVSSSNFELNQAAIGAVFFSYYNSLIQQGSGNVFTNNLATSFGAMDVHVPLSLQFQVGSSIYSSGDLIQLNYLGHPEERMVGMFMTEYGEQFKDLASGTVTLVLTGVGTKQIIQEGKQISWSDGVFDIGSEIVLYGQLKAQYVINMQVTFTNSLYVKSFTEINTATAQIDFVFQFLYQCSPGWYLTQYSGKYDICEACETGTYSLLPNQSSCKQCPVEYAECEADKLLLKDGYWRSDQMSSVIVECDSGPSYCIGDLHDLDQLRQDLKTFNSTQNYYCAVGHIGAKCEDCDIRAINWKDSYMQTETGACQNCNSDAAWNLAKMMLIQMFSLALTLFQVYQTIDSMTNVILGDYCQRMGFKLTGSAGSNQNEDTAIYMKIINNYMQILSIITSMDYGIPSSLTTVIQGGANPLSTSMNTSDCIVNDVYTILGIQYDMIYFRVIASQAIFLGLLLCVLFLICFAALVMRRGHFLKSYLINGCVLFFSLNQTSVVGQALGTVACEDIGEKSYVINYTSVECNDQHSSDSLVYVYPILLFWAFVIPAILMVILRWKQGQLNHVSTMLSYGFLYSEYRESAYQWEMVKILQKMALLIISKLFISQPVQNLSWSIMIMLAYKFIAYFKQPYRSKDLNILDNYLTDVGCASLGIVMVIMKSQSEWLTGAAAFALVAINFWYVMQIVCGLFRQYLKMAIELVTDKLPNLPRDSIIRRFFGLFNIISQKRVQYLWDVLRGSVRKMQLNKIERVKRAEGGAQFEFLKDQFTAAKKTMKMHGITNPILKVSEDEVRKLKDKNKEIDLMNQRTETENEKLNFKMKVPVSIPSEPSESNSNWSDF